MKQTAYRYKKYGEEVIRLDADKTDSFEAKLALSYVAKWGMILAMPDGEDSSGRQKLKPSTPEEVVKRAFDTASLAIKEIEARGLWLDIVDLPEGKENK